MSASEEEAREISERVTRGELSLDELRALGAHNEMVASMARSFADDEAFVAFVARRQAALREQAEQERREQLSRLTSAGAPRKDVWRVVDGELDETKAIAAVRAAIRRAEWLTVLAGRPGVGKTTAAVDWLHRRGGGRFITAPELQEMGLFDARGRRELVHAPAVVIDDLGAEYFDAGGAFASQLDAVINHRYAEVRPTLITTNLPSKDFRARYGVRVIDRIREAGRFVELAGKSLRGAPR